jgi:hypothetical protein
LGQCESNAERLEEDFVEGCSRESIIKSIIIKILWDSNANTDSGEQPETKICVFNILHS